MPFLSVQSLGYPPVHRGHDERAQATRDTTGLHGSNAPAEGGPLRLDQEGREGTNLDEISRGELAKHILSAYEAERAALARSARMTARR